MRNTVTCKLITTLNLLLIFSFFAITLTLLKNHISASVYPWGDLATDMLLGRQIEEDGYLLTGHYSRFGFNHPGPFFFYLNYLVEKLCLIGSCSQYGAWVLSTALLNVGCLVLSAWLLSRLFDNNPLMLALAAVSPLLTVIGNDQFNLWMPYRLILPFMAYFCALIVVLRGKFRYLPAVMLLGCILIHGYVTLPLFTLIPIACIVYWQWEKSGKRFNRQDKKAIIISLIIGALFIAPLLIDLIINSPSNVERILHALSAHKDQDFSGKDSLRFMLSFWSTYKVLVLSALCTWLACAAHFKLEPVSPTLRSCLIALLMISLLFFFYHGSAPKPLHPFIAVYYWGAIFSCSALLFLNALNALPKLRLKTTIALAAIVISLTAFSRMPVAPPPNWSYLKELAEKILQDDKDQYRLNYPETTISTFADTAGILYYLRARGYNVCITRPELSVTFTPKGVCDSGPADYLVRHSANCNGSPPNNCLAQSGTAAIQRAEQLSAARSFIYPGCMLPSQNSEIDEKECSTSRSNPGFVTYGPYVTLESGQYGFEIQYISKANTSEVIGAWDIVTNSGKTQVQTGNVQGTDGGLSTISGRFEATQSSVFEIRLISQSNKYLSIKHLKIKRI